MLANRRTHLTRDVQQDPALVRADRELDHESLVPRELEDGAVNVVDLRQDRVFELRCVADLRVERGYASNRAVEVLEQLVGDAGRDLSSVAPGNWILVVRRIEASIADQS